MSLPAANFHEVYQAHSREVYRFALYLCGDASRAEDLAAEAFLRIWTTPAPVQIKTVKSYLLAIVRNLYVEAWRREHRETALEETRAPGEGPDRALDDRAELGRVVAALQGLDPVDRAAVLLRSDHEMSYEEIARLLEISPVSARVRVHRARQKLMQARKGTTAS